MHVGLCGRFHRFVNITVAPRFVDCHLDMVLGAIEARTHVFMEKPMALTPVGMRSPDRRRRPHPYTHWGLPTNMRCNPMARHGAESPSPVGLIGEIQEIRGAR